MSCDLFTTEPAAVELIFGDYKGEFFNHFDKKQRAADVSKQLKQEKKNPCIISVVNHSPM